MSKELIDAETVMSQIKKMMDYKPSIDEFQYVFVIDEGVIMSIYNIETEPILIGEVDPETFYHLEKTLTTSFDNLEQKIIEEYMDVTQRIEVKTTFTYTLEVLNSWTKLLLVVVLDTALFSVYAYYRIHTVL